MNDADERVQEVDTRIKPAVTRYYSREELGMTDDGQTRRCADRGKKTILALGGFLLLAGGSILYAKLTVSRVPYVVLEQKSQKVKHRCTLTISVPPGTSPADIDYALENAGRVAKGKDRGMGAVMVWAVYQDNPRRTVRGGVFAPEGEWPKADGTVLLDKWSYKSMGELATDRW